MSSVLKEKQESISLEAEMRRSYLDYAMSVIVARALPDARDGLKPVQRRILYAMKAGNFDWDKPHRKSARIVGDVMAIYHPHGDQAIYDALVRMAQDFSMRLPLIDGQGNFGSMDGDPPAAMRYTETRLAKVAATGMLIDIDRDTVDFHPNYDESAEEPAVLPVRLPHLLANGSGGIAVGMATNIPPHNLGELIDVTLAQMANPDISLADIMRYLPGPDFPTGGTVIGHSGIAGAYKSGRSSIILRGRSNIEEIRKDRKAIIITEIPYQVNKARLIERIAELVRAREVDGIADLRDESNREGVRIVIELKREAQAEVVLNQLYRYSPLQISFGANMVALRNGRPELLSIKDLIGSFIKFREETVRRRTLYDLNRARVRAHILIGLAIAVTHIDRMIDMIRNAPDIEAARHALLSHSWSTDSIAALLIAADEDISLDNTIHLSEAQVRAVLELRLQRLTGLEREKISAELEDLGGHIKNYLAILSSSESLQAVIREELIALRDEFATPRRTQIEDTVVEKDIIDFIPREDMVVTVSHRGYIKRTPLSSYRAQRRGGRGRSGMVTRDEDFVTKVFVANTHTEILFFSVRGFAYKRKVYQLPLGPASSRGKAIVNILPMRAGEGIAAVLALPESIGSEQEACLSIVFATSSGMIRRNRLSEFRNVMANGKIAMSLERDGESLDKLVGVVVADEDNDILLSSRRGKCIRFPVKDLRIFLSRQSLGVRGIKLVSGDEVISLSVLHHVELGRAERDAYLRSAAWRRGNSEDMVTGDRGDEDETFSEEDDEELTTDEKIASTSDGIVNTELIGDMAPEQLKALAAQEQFILTVTENGFGKRSSSYEYRVTRRGGGGIANIKTSPRNGLVVGSFPVGDRDEVMLMTDDGQVIRCPVHDIRIAGRHTQGVTLLRVESGGRVVSVARLLDEEGGTEELSL